MSASPTEGYFQKIYVKHRKNSIGLGIISEDIKKFEDFKSYSAVD